MWYRANQRFLNQGISNGWEKSKEVLNIISHLENANQNNPKIPPHTCQIGQDQISDNSRCWWGCGERGTLLDCWSGCKLIQPLWKSIWGFLRKLDIVLPEDPATWTSSYTSGNIPQRHSNIQQIYMHHNVHSSSICNSQKLERTQMSFIRWMDTKIVVHLHNGVQLSYQKQWLNKILKKMVASREYHPEWDNPITKRINIICRQ